MRSRASVCALWLLAGACSAEPAASEEQPRAVPDASTPLRDRDRDGLCDDTEDEHGTDPSAVDSDRDALPDLIELWSGFDATNPAHPAADQVGYLEASVGSRLEFPVRITIDGKGQGVSGTFHALTALYADGLSAAAFFEGASAIAALPADGARSIDEGSAYFASVLGKTRLVFTLHFAYAHDDLDEPECARVYPFRYAIKSDDGTTRAERIYLLVVTPAGSPGPGAEHCLPSTCQ